MKLGHLEINYKKDDNVPTKNLYVALIGKINPEYISNDSYIHRGEEGTHYTVVRKLDNIEGYIDLFENTGYTFRDESSEKTILTLYAFLPDKEYINMEYLQDILNAYDEIIDDKKPKPGNNKVYTRTRHK